jgi:hypothetical protein
MEEKKIGDFFLFHFTNIIYALCELFKQQAQLIGVLVFPTKC